VSVKRIDVGSAWRASSMNCTARSFRSSQYSCQLCTGHCGNIGKSVSRAGYTYTPVTLYRTRENADLRRSSEASKGQLTIW